jgi:hypothetical protein
MTVGLHHHHRLQSRRRTRRREELARVADRFDVQQDCAGMAVAGEVIEQVGEVDIERIAERGNGREPKRPARTPFHQRRGNRRGLRDHSEVAGQCRVRGKAGVESRMRRQDAQGVGADDAQAVGAGDAGQLRRRRVGALAHSGVEHDRRRSALLGGGAGEPGHERVRRGDYDQFRRPRQVLDPRHRGDAFDLVEVRIDQSDLAGEAAIDQVAQHRPAGRLLARATAHDRHRSGIEDGFE